ncbi:NADPH-dependent F420 reductase [Youngiibacter fragilis]|uniref:NADP oxidoreductase n=1 Tax=Youngiibacter fragilis 232.1 TaxID=994573 RepID=V7I207_9CLOT|nr:NAD(P)-binding domain-containing protein [Youngiibacter fragilis]ETA79908.1 NADP oxidoreductase [Youngiibacter fragilis 232.1]
MKIGIIGAGTVGSVLARSMAMSGHEVYIANSRDPGTLSGVFSEFETVHPVWKDDLKSVSEILVLAVRWKDTGKVLEELGDMGGRILIDVTNNVDESFDLIDLGGKPSSMVIQELVPSARVVKAFNTFKISRYLDDRGKGIISFLAGDDGQALETVSNLVTSMGFIPYITGSLSFGGRLMNVKGRLAGKARSKDEADSIVREEAAKET